MEGFFSTIQVFFVCVTAMTIGFFALLAIPQSKVADFVLPIMAAIASARKELKEKKEEQNS
jgi:hypothetical protein